MADAPASPEKPESPPEPEFVPEHTFDAVLELESENGGVYFLVPPTVDTTSGPRGPLKVRVRIDGFPLQTALSTLTDGTPGIVVPRVVRNAVGKTWGHTVHVELARDTAPRQVSVPEDFADALLITSGAREKFERLSYSHQREYVRWVEAAKKDDTRRKRVVEAAEMVAAGKKRSV